MSNCRTVEEARAWMATRGIHQLGTEHLTRRSGPGHPAHNDVMEASAGTTNIGFRLRES